MHTSTHALTGPVVTGHVGLSVVDLQRSIDFYTSVFGLQNISMSNEPGRQFAFLGDGHRLVLTLWQQSANPYQSANAGLHHLSFEVASEKELERAESALRELNIAIFHQGAIAHRQGADSGGLFFLDPDGIRLEIYSPKGLADHAAPANGAPACGFF